MCAGRNLLEDPWAEPSPDMFTRSVSPEQAPDKATYLNIDFERGDPVALDGEQLSPATLLARLNKVRARDRCRVRPGSAGVALFLVESLAGSLMYLPVLGGPCSAVCFHLAKSAGIGRIDWLQAVPELPCCCRKLCLPPPAVVPLFWSCEEAPMAVTLRTESVRVTMCTQLAGDNGIGRVDIVESRFVGMKSRGVYETPGGTVLMTARRAVESICLDRGELHLKVRNTGAGLLGFGF